MSETREFPIVAGPGFKWNTHEPIVGPAPVRDTSAPEDCDVRPDESAGWQQVGWVDEAYSFPAMSQIQQRMNERVRETIDRVMAPALIRKPDRYSISWRDPSPIQPASGADLFAEFQSPTLFERLVEENRERWLHHLRETRSTLDRWVF